MHFQVDVLAKELQNLANRVQQQRAENLRLCKEKSNIIVDLEHSEEVLKKLMQRYNAMNNKNLNAQERLRILEELMDAEDKTQKDINRETDSVNGLIYRSQQQLNKLKGDSKTLAVNQFLIFFFWWQNS